MRSAARPGACAVDNQATLQTRRTHLVVNCSRSKLLWPYFRRKKMDPNKPEQVKEKSMTPDDGNSPNLRVIIRKEVAGALSAAQSASYFQAAQPPCSSGELPNGKGPGYYMLASHTLEQWRAGARQRRELSRVSVARQSINIQRASSHEADLRHLAISQQRWAGYNSMGYKGSNRCEAHPTAVRAPTRLPYSGGSKGSRTTITNIIR